MDKQVLETYAEREALTVEMLIYILFEKHIGELEKERIAYNFYPTMRTPESEKVVPLYANFRKWIIAFIHPRPNFSAKFGEILGVAVRPLDIYSWYQKSRSKFTFSPEAKQFFKYLERKQVKAEKATSIKSKNELRKLETQKRDMRWNKEYRALKKKHPDKTDRWCAIQIAKMPVGERKSPDTIRKNMKG